MRCSCCPVLSSTVLSSSSNFFSRHLWSENALTLTDRATFRALLMASVHYLVMFATKFNYSYLFFVLAASHLRLPLLSLLLLRFMIFNFVKNAKNTKMKCEKIKLKNTFCCPGCVLAAIFFGFFSSLLLLLLLLLLLPVSCSPVRLMFSSKGQISEAQHSTARCTWPAYPPFLPSVTL